MQTLATIEEIRKQSDYTEFMARFDLGWRRALQQDPAFLAEQYRDYRHGKALEEAMTEYGHAGCAHCATYVGPRQNEPGWAPARVLATAERLRGLVDDANTRAQHLTEKPGRAFVRVRYHLPRHGKPRPVGLSLAGLWTLPPELREALEVDARAEGARAA